MFKIVSKFLFNKEIEKILNSKGIYLRKNNFLMGYVSGLGDKAEGNIIVRENSTFVTVKKSSNNLLTRKCTIKKERHYRDTTAAEAINDSEKVMNDSTKKSANRGSRKNFSKISKESERQPTDHSECRRKLLKANCRLFKLENALDRDIKILRHKKQRIMNMMGKRENLLETAPNQIVKKDSKNVEIDEINKKRIEDTSNFNNADVDPGALGDYETEFGSSKLQNVKSLITTPMGQVGFDQVLNMCYGCQCMGTMTVCHSPNVCSPQRCNVGTACGLRNYYCMDNYHCGQGHYCNCCECRKKCVKVSESFRRKATDLKTEYFYHRKIESRASSKSSKSLSPDNRKNEGYEKRKKSESPIKYDSKNRNQSESPIKYKDSKKFRQLNTHKSRRDVHEKKILKGQSEQKNLEKADPTGLTSSTPDSATYKVTNQEKILEMSLSTSSPMPCSQDKSVGHCQNHESTSYDESLYSEETIKLLKKMKIREYLATNYKQKISQSKIKSYEEYIKAYKALYADAQPEDQSSPVRTDRDKSFRNLEEKQKKSDVETQTTKSIAKRKQHKNKCKQNFPENPLYFECGKDRRYKKYYTQSSKTESPKSSTASRPIREKSFSIDETWSESDFCKNISKRSNLLQEVADDLQSGNTYVISPRLRKSEKSIKSSSRRTGDYFTAVEPDVSSKKREQKHKDIIQIQCKVKNLENFLKATNKRAENGSQCQYSSEQIQTLINYRITDSNENGNLNKEGNENKKLYINCKLLQTESVSQDVEQSLNEKKNGTLKNRNESAEELLELNISNKHQECYKNIGDNLPSSRKGLVKDDLKEKLREFKQMKEDELREALREYKQNEEDQIRKTLREYKQKEENEIIQSLREYKQNKEYEIINSLRQYKEIKESEITENSREYKQNAEDEIRQSLREYKQNAEDEIRESLKQYKQNKEGEITESLREYKQNVEDEIRQSLREYNQNMEDEIRESLRQYKQNKEGESSREYKPNAEVEIKHNTSGVIHREDFMENETDNSIKKTMPTSCEDFRSTIQCLADVLKLYQNGQFQDEHLRKLTEELYKFHNLKAQENCSAEKNKKIQEIQFSQQRESPDYHFENIDLTTRDLKTKNDYATLSDTSVPQDSVNYKLEKIVKSTSDLRDEQTGAIDKAIKFECSPLTYKSDPSININHYESLKIEQNSKDSESIQVPNKYLLQMCQQMCQQICQQVCLQLGQDQLSTKTKISPPLEGYSNSNLEMFSNKEADGNYSYDFTDMCRDYNQKKIYQDQYDINEGQQVCQQQQYDECIQGNNFPQRRIDNALICHPSTDCQQSQRNIPSFQHCPCMMETYLKILKIYNKTSRMPIGPNCMINC